MTATFVRRLLVVGVILALAALGVAAFFLVRSLLPPPTELVTVPNVVGQPEEDAVETLEDAGFEVQVDEEFNEEVQRGLVIEQDPPANDRIEEGSEVTILVSRGPPLEAVPDVVGLTEEDARETLEEAGFEVGTVTDRDSEEEEGTVLEQDPPSGAEARPGSPVDLVVSSGPATVAVPDVICQDIDSAQGEVESAGLDFVVTGSRFSDECPPGTVAEQNPGPGTQVEPGTNVRVKESTGPSPEPTITITISP